MVISQNSLSNMTTNCANCDYSAINGSKVIHNVEGVKINFAQLFYEDFKTASSRAGKNPGFIKKKQPTWVF